MLLSKRAAPKETKTEERSATIAPFLLNFLFLCWFFDAYCKIVKTLLLLS